MAKLSQGRDHVSIGSGCVIGCWSARSRSRPARGRRGAAGRGKFPPGSTGHHAAVVADVGPGKTVGRVGLPQEDSVPDAIATFFKNVTIGGGPAPVRAYIEEQLPDVLDGRIEPGRVFDRGGSLDQVADGYRAMNERESIKFLIEF